MRRKLDAYYTPEWAVDELVKHVGIWHGVSILEPCDGQGAISTRLAHHNFGPIYTNDIDESCNTDTHFDYLTRKLVPSAWVITNPPFNKAFKFLVKACAETSIGVALLLRLSFLEPTKERGRWLAANPPNVTIVMPRISFTGNGKTDSVTTAWFVWLHGDTTQRTIIVPKKAK